MIEKSFKKPIYSDNILETAIIGTVLTLLSILILPAFIISGFAMKVIHNESNNKPVPKFEDFTQLFVIGVKYFGIILGYVGIIMILSFIMGFLGSISEIASLLFGLFILFPAYLIYFYLLPAVMYEYSQDYKIKDAFKFKKMMNYITTLQYLKISLVLFILVPIVTFVLSFAVSITVIGILLIPAINIYQLMVQGQLVAEIENIKSN